MALIHQKDDTPFFPSRIETIDKTQLQQNLYQQKANKKANNLMHFFNDPTPIGRKVIVALFDPKMQCYAHSFARD